MKIQTKFINTFHQTKADIEIESIIKLVLVGIGIIIAIIIITTLFNQDVSESMSKFFDILP